MDINIIISGNLTGFSQFYATPNVDAVYSEAKFDFDYRNYITYLNNGEKTYAISFSPSSVAVSLITRILDSFRRPGILVVTALVPRGKSVESVMNPQNKSALYQLLNEINDKFYERNFMNGMMNQNAAVLMQDYYSDIISNYRLVMDSNHRKINANIDINTPNKRIGYVATGESDVPSYLYSLYRRNYEGYHHVFFAYNSPQNIEETPIEEVLYRVYITNNQMSLPGFVKLTDRIHQLSPNKGEIAFDQNYTYGDVIQGKAGNQIIAYIEGEKIEMTYRFQLEEKNINFIFENRGKKIPFTQILPVIEEVDGTKSNLPSETYKFRGNEIYTRKILRSTNSNWIINQASSVLDLQRLNDGATFHVHVEEGSVLELRFAVPYDIPKTIKITRRGTNQTHTLNDVRDYVRQEISGKLEEWDYRIESNAYETLTGRLSKEPVFNFKAKPQSNVNARTITHSPIKAVNLGGVSSPKTKPERKLNVTKLLSVIGVLCVLTLGVLVGVNWSNWFGSKGENVVDEEYIEFTLTVCGLNGGKFDNDTIIEYINNGFLKIETSHTYSEQVKFNGLKGSVKLGNSFTKECDIPIHIYLEDKNSSKNKKIFLTKEKDGRREQCVKLSDGSGEIELSELKDYLENYIKLSEFCGNLENETSKEDINKYINIADNLIKNLSVDKLKQNVQEYKKMLKGLSEDEKTKGQSAPKSEKSNGGSPEQGNIGVNEEINENHDDLGWTLEDGDMCIQYIKVNDESSEKGKRKAALKFFLEKFKEGNVPDIEKDDNARGHLNNLSRNVKSNYGYSQQGVVKKLFEIKKNLETQSNRTDLDEKEKRRLAATLRGFPEDVKSKSVSLAKICDIFKLDRYNNNNIDDEND